MMDYCRADCFYTGHKIKFFIMESNVVMVKIPSPMRLLLASLCAYWLAGIFNPAFVAIAVLILLLIPVVLVEFYSFSRAKN
jgi:hypothetical protein